MYALQTPAGAAEQTVHLPANNGVLKCKCVRPCIYAKRNETHCFFSTFPFLSSFTPSFASAWVVYGIQSPVSKQEIAFNYLAPDSLDNAEKNVKGKGRRGPHGADGVRREQAREVSRVLDGAAQRGGGTVDEHGAAQSGGYRPVLQHRRDVSAVRSA